MLNPNNKFEFDSYYDTEHVNGVNKIFNHFHGETENKICYASFLGEKVDKGYEDLLSSLIRDPEFLEIYTEYQEKEKILFDFNSLRDDRKIEILIKCFFILKSQKDQVIDEYWRLKTDLEEKQRISTNNLIEKYKNEAYTYKCERDELKIQISNLKTKKDGRDKDIDKVLAKLEKYKERVTELEKTTTKFENDKKEMEIQFLNEFNQVTSKYDQLLKQNEDSYMKLKDKEEEIENLQRRIDDFKMKCENLSSQVKDLTERNIKLQRISRKTHATNNFCSQINTNNEGGFALDGLMMTENNFESVIEKPAQYTMSMKVNLKEVKAFNNMNNNLTKLPNNLTKIREEENKNIIFKEEIFAIKDEKKDDDDLYSATNTEDNADIEKEYLTDNKKVDDNVDTIHIFQSQISAEESFESHNNSNFVTINEDHMTEMQSNLDSLNLNTNNSRSEDFQTNNYDTLRQFHHKRYDDQFRSNDMKF